jgi:hypothetical protein
MSRLRDPGVTRPDTAPARSSGLIDDWCIAVADRWRARRTTVPTATPTRDLDQHETDTIRQHAEAAHRG